MTVRHEYVLVAWGRRVSISAGAARQRLAFILKMSSWNGGERTSIGHGERRRQTGQTSFVPDGFGLHVDHRKPRGGERIECRQFSRT
jgi:hypothetical protein